MTSSTNIPDEPLIPPISQYYPNLELINLESMSFRINHHVSNIIYSHEYAEILPCRYHMLDVYYSSLIPCPDEPCLFPPERSDYVKSIELKHARSQSYTAWKLLEAAIKHSFDMSMQELSPHKLTSGKWVSSSLFFSISHTKTSAAVAVSDSDVGIDIEDMDFFASKHSSVPQNLIDRILSPNDEPVGHCNHIGFLQLWTAKESIFKLLGREQFIPSEIDAASFPTASVTAALEHRNVISVACTEPTPIRVFKVDFE